MSAPPGKSGGAVSGAGPCARTCEAHSRNITDKRTYNFACDLTIYLPMENSVRTEAHLPVGYNEWKETKSEVVSNRRCGCPAEHANELQPGRRENKS